MKRSCYLWIPIVTGVFVILLFGCASDQPYWKKAEATNTTRSYEEFLSHHPNSEFAREARSRIHKLREKEAEDRILRQEKEKAQRLEDANRKWGETVKDNSFDAYIDFYLLYPELYSSKVREKITTVIEQVGGTKSAIRNPANLDDHSSIVKNNNRIYAHNVKITFPNKSSMILNKGFSYGYYGVKEIYTMAGPIAHISFNSKLSYTFIIDEGTLVFEGDKEALRYVAGKGAGLLWSNEQKVVYVWGP